jgi:flagellar motor switch/type III secretory pathway protein FliN
MTRAAIQVDAVLARVRMPADAVAALSPNDRLDLEPEAGSQLLVRLMAEGKTIAVASVEVVDGRLVATIINNGPGVAGRRIDQWKHTKAKTTA